MKQKLYFFLPTVVLFSSYYKNRSTVEGQNSCVMKGNLEFSDSVLDTGPLVD